MREEPRVQNQPEGQSEWWFCVFMNIFLSFQELKIFGQTPEWQRQVKLPVGGAWASLMLANTRLVHCPCPLRVFYLYHSRGSVGKPSQRSNLLLHLQLLPCVLVQQHKNNCNNKDRVVNRFAVLWPCCSRLDHSLVIASCVPVISYREGSTWNTSGPLGAIHLAACFNNSLHSGLFSTSVRGLDQDVDFLCAVLPAQRWGTIFEIREWAVC